MSDKHLGQRINIKFRVKICKSANKTLALLTLVYGEYSKMMCKMIQEVGSQKCKGHVQMWTEYEPWCAQIED
jgi:hypothetical protein